MPQATAFVTRTGTSLGVVDGGPHALMSAGAGAVAQAPAAEEDEGEVEGAELAAFVLQAATQDGERAQGHEETGTWHGDRVAPRPQLRVSQSRGRCRAEVGRYNGATVNRFQKLAALTPRDGPRPGHHRRHRSSHRLRPWLPRLAAVPRPADPGARRPEGLDRMGPSNGRGRHRLRDPGARGAGVRRPPRPAIHPVADARGGRPGRVPGVARARDGPPRQQRGVGHGPPGRGDDAGRPAGLPHGPAGLPGPARGRGASQRFTLLAAFRAARHVRAAAVRVARHRDRHRARLPGLAADGWLALPAADRRDRAPRCCIAGSPRSSA